MAFKPVYFDFESPVITPDGGAAITLTETTRIQVLKRDNLEKWQPGGAQFATVVAISESERGCSLEGGDINKLDAIPSGTPCTITGVIRNARNGSGEGALNFSLANAVKQDSSFATQARKFSGGGVDFIAFSTDGNTDPMTISVVPAPGAAPPSAAVAGQGEPAQVSAASGPEPVPSLAPAAKPGG